MSMFTARRLILFRQLRPHSSGVLKFRGSNGYFQILPNRPSMNHPNRNSVFITCTGCSRRITTQFPLVSTSHPAGTAFLIFAAYSFRVACSSAGGGLVWRGSGRRRGCFDCRANRGVFGCRWNCGGLGFGFQLFDDDLGDAGVFGDELYEITGTGVHDVWGMVVEGMRVMSDFFPETEASGKRRKKSIPRALHAAWTDVG